MWFSGLDKARVTSKFEELSLQGDQPHRGLRLATGGIQGISSTEDYHQLQLGAIPTHEGIFLRRTIWRACHELNTVMPLCCSLQRKNHGWEGCFHLLGIMMAAEE